MKPSIQAKPKHLRFNKKGGGGWFKQYLKAAKSPETVIFILPLLKGDCATAGDYQTLDSLACVVV